MDIPLEPLFPLQCEEPLLFEDATPLSEDNIPYALLDESLSDDEVKEKKECSGIALDRPEKLDDIEKDQTIFTSSSEPLLYCLYRECFTNVRYYRNVKRHASCSFDMILRDKRIRNLIQTLNFSKEMIWIANWGEEFYCSTHEKDTKTLETKLAKLLPSSKPFCRIWNILVVYSKDMEVAFLYGCRQKAGNLLIGTTLVLL